MKQFRKKLLYNNCLFLIVLHNMLIFIEYKVKKEKVMQRVEKNPPGFTLSKKIYL